MRESRRIELRSARERVRVNIARRDLKKMSNKSLFLQAAHSLRKSSAEQVLQHRIMSAKNMTIPHIHSKL